ncbi:putative ABC transporter ATP-binding protein ywjA [Proteiniborus sp. DW1]|uniref:ABC transporter ATP-binding protein n=1 Tax=Proteiniborus sp. DW1 TaxID=1889883 RepID=UPI00092E1E23|nr:ABC transporter ATP-binding protein [Proteiniborus sp. DW1]SCG82383.1 putative ABC transporter ATP-binding protein ywjA [Proteiniborus sp. DW1]
MLRKFITYYRPHWKLFLLDMICAFMISALDLVFPMATSKVIDDVIPNKELRSLVIITGVLVLLYILRYMCNYIVDSWGHIVGTRMEFDMRKEIFSHIQTLSFSYFDNTKTGHIMSRIVNDLREITELAHHGPEDLFISFVMLIGSFIILLNVEWRLTLIIFAFVPIMIWFAIAKRRKLENAFMEQRKKIAAVNAQLENSISGVRVSKSFTNEDFEVEKFNVGNNEFRETRESAFKVMAEFTSGVNFFSNILNLVALSAGGYFAYREYISYGELVSFLLYVNFFLQPIRRLAQFIQQYQEGMTGFRRFQEILNIEPDIVDSENAVELENVKGNIELRNVTFSYQDNDKTVLAGLNYTIKPGETLALVGPSGGGKTTLCHLIPRFYELDEGDILIDGISIKDIKLKSLRKNIGLVQQDVFLFTGTIKENILYGNLDATDEEVIEAAKNANIHDFIMTLPNGYDTYVGEKGVKLSGGQKQRISIARVFLKNPPILILDEATSALDNETEIAIQESLERLSKGRTTLVIAHRLSTIRNADEIVVLTDKGIEEKGRHEELLARNGIYAKLYKAQFRGYIPDGAA